MNRPDPIPRLTERVIAATERVVLLDALPGTGKTLLLDTLREVADRHGRHIADTATDLANGTIPVQGRWVIAARPNQLLGLERLRVYGEILEFGNADLFLPPDKALAYARSGGWPALDSFFARKPDARPVAIRYLSQELATYPTALRDMLGVLAHAEQGIADADLTDDERACLRWLGPVCHHADERWSIASPGLADLFREASAAWPVSKCCAERMYRAIAPAKGILAALDNGHRDLALKMLKDAGGLFFLHLHGLQAGERVLAGFGNDPDPDLVGLAFLMAAKKGNTERAMHLLAEATSARHLDLSQTPEDWANTPPPLLFCRLMTAIYRSGNVRQHIFTEASNLLARLELDNALLRGGIYNAVLELHIRAERFVEAEEAASRSLRHYERAGAPYLQFFIHLHRAVIQLRSGYPARAREHLVSAEKALDETPFDSPQDRRFLRVLNAAVAYERGEAEPMAEFSLSTFRDFTYGELWPSLAELALTHGGDALLMLHGKDIALSFTDRWNLQSWRTRRFQVLIEQRQVAVLQGARRWRDARLRLEGMAARIGRVWMESAAHNLHDLRTPEDILQAMLWMRQQCFEVPRNSEMPKRLEALARNPAVSVRHRICLRIWQAWVERRQGRVTRAQRLLDEVLRYCDRRDCVAPILEERVFVLPLLDDPRMMSGDLKSASVPRNMRRGAVAGFGTGPLSRQEWRALLLLAEGCSNKDIAREMDLSLPTVKFHLKNLYRKLDANDRKQAVDHARMKGLIAE